MAEEAAGLAINIMEVPGSKLRDLISSYFICMSLL
jgi:hypothetical protein